MPTLKSRWTVKHKELNLAMRYDVGDRINYITDDKGQLWVQVNPVTTIRNITDEKLNKLRIHGFIVN